jgi:prephenate dehydrogenase
MTSPADRRAQVVGTGLIGGSIGLALRERGWHVTGTDADDARAARALELGAVDAVGVDADAAITFVATPVSSVAGIVRDALDRGGVVTDAGSVKASIVAAVDHPSFVGGHPMAGSEQEGVDGSRADLFQGAVWVLTPTASTDHAAHTLVRSVVTSLGAQVVELSPTRHDALVAVVSHVPHLTAATLMSLAAEGAEEHRAMLRLAAGGFRDMTRIASGSPTIWPDICEENRDAIVAALDELTAALQKMRDVVAAGDRASLLDVLEKARAGRVNLPARIASMADMAEVRVPVPDREGVLAEVTTLASALGVSIADIEIVHSLEGDAGVVVMLVPVDAVDRLTAGLIAREYRSSWRVLE